MCTISLSHFICVGFRSFAALWKARGAPAPHPKTLSPHAIAMSQTTSRGPFSCGHIILLEVPGDREVFRRIGKPVRVYKTLTRRCPRNGSRTERRDGSHWTNSLGRCRASPEQGRFWSPETSHRRSKPGLIAVGGREADAWRRRVHAGSARGNVSLLHRRGGP
jgi:hypothetical protein